MEEKQEKNIEQILDIMKNSYNQYYNRMQSIDNKSGFFIAFHAAVLLLVVDPENIKEILQIHCSNLGETLKYTSIAIFTIFAFILAIIAICLFICSLKSRNIKYLPATICDDKYYNCENIDLKKELIKGYKEISQYNEKIIEKKHSLYNYASIITLIQVIFIGIKLIFQMI